MLNRSASLVMLASVPKPCLVNLISKDTHLVFAMYIFKIAMFVFIPAKQLYVCTYLYIFKTRAPYKMANPSSRNHGTMRQVVVEGSKYWMTTCNR